MPASVDTIATNGDAYPRGAAVANAAARTATTVFGPFETRGAAGITVIIEVTSINAGTPSITVQMQGVTVFGTAYTIFQSVALNAVGVTRLQINPSLLGVVNVSANSQLPDKMQVQVTHADGQAITYQISAILHRD